MCLLYLLAAVGNVREGVALSNEVVNALLFAGAVDSNSKSIWLEGEYGKDSTVFAEKTGFRCDVAGRGGGSGKAMASGGGNGGSGGGACK